MRRVLLTFWRWRVAELLKKASTIHAVGKREASILVSHYTKARSKIVVIPNGVEEDVLSHRWQGQGSNYIVYAGRVEKYKSQEIAADIAKELNLKLLIIGKRPYKEKLVRYASKVYRGCRVLIATTKGKILGASIKSEIHNKRSKHEVFNIFAVEALTREVSVITIQL